MGYAALLVYIEPDEAAEARISLAAGLADRFNATLIGLASREAMPPAVTAPVLGGAVAAEILEAEQERVEAGLRAARQRFLAAAQRDGRSTGWRSFLEHPADALGREARAADLLILGRGRGASWQGTSRAADPGDVLMRAGRPVLVVPPGVSGLEGRRALVAWKDTREARRAVADALPLLVRAEEVLVLEVVRDEAEEGEQAQARADDVAAFLMRHGAPARGAVAGLRGPAAADELLSAAERHGADLVVSGAYGHARLREWAFGGVTRDLLARCTTCCLLSR